MKRCYLLLGIAAILAVGAPAHSQYIFMDVNGDGICDATDTVNDATTAIDIYLDTNHSATGSAATCASAPGTPLDMFGYDVIVGATGNGSVGFSGWTNAMTAGGTWSVLDAFRTSGGSASVGYATSGSNVSGKFKLGTFNVTVTGTPAVSFLTDNTSLGGLGAPITGFGGSCSGQDFAFTVVLGTDFTDHCGILQGTDVKATTWGAIKNLYR